MSELIVPIDVRALCVSQYDNTQSSQSFAGATLDFTRLPYKGGDTPRPSISCEDTILRSMNRQPYKKLGAGAHLHWSLPRALTKGNDTATELEFPTLPNRWLVTRVVTHPEWEERSWVIESDHLNPSEDQGAINSLAVDDATPYRYIGRAVDLWDWEEQTPAEGLYDLAHSHLHAVQTGEPIFAAYYPNCMNIFGFHDDLEDVSGDVSLMYVVTGWFSDPSLDPLHDNLTLAEIEQRLGWLAESSDPNTTCCDATLLSGFVQGISWHPDTPYFTSDDDIDADLSIGNNPAEALATWISAWVQETSEREDLEDLFSAFQLGLLNQFANTDMADLPSMMDGLQRAKFGSAHGGTSWTIVKEGQTGTEMAELPTDVARALDDLNKVQKTYDDVQASNLALRWQLFADWYRYCIAVMVTNNDPDQNSIRYYLNLELSEIFSSDYLTQQVDTATTALSQQKAAVEGKLVGTAWQLKALSAPRFYQAHDPVILLSGSDLSHRSSGIGADDLLHCRTGSQVLTSLAVTGHPIDASRYDFWLEEALPYLSACESLLGEACLVNQQLWGSLGIQISKEYLNDFFKDGTTNQFISAFHGKHPSSLAAQWWDGNPWLPLVMIWEGELVPLQNISADEKYSSSVVTDDFEIDRSRSEIRPTNDLPATTAQSLSGSVVISPLATKNLHQAISKLQATDLPPEVHADLTEALDDLTKSPMALQSLAGLTEALLLRQSTPQLPVTAPNSPTSSDKRLAPKVSDGVLNQNTHGLLPNNSFHPIRGGYLQNLEIVLVDVFGRKRKVKPNDFHCSSSLRAGSTEGHRQVYLPPRITQPARLLFRYLAADDDEMEMNPASSPVCGWMVYNHLERSLALYDHLHQLRGSFYLSEGQVIWRTAPGLDKGNSLAGAMSGVNGYLADFASSIEGNGPNFLKAFLDNLSQASSTIDASHDRNPSLSVLIGRPFALIQVSLELELQGRPAVNQNWSAFKNEVENFELDSSTFLEGRETNGFEGVELPLWLGARLREEDGLVGYFLEGASGYDFSGFYGVAASGQAGVELQTCLSLAPEDPARKFLMIADPRAKIHATMGFLPTKAIEIPPDRYADMLAALEVNFPVSAVLGPADQFALPLPSEPGFEWSWVENVNSKWETNPANPLPQTGLFSYTPQTINSGWLRLQRKAENNS